MGTFFSGLSASASVNGTLRPGRKWTIEDEVGEVDVSNFTSPTDADGQKWREWLPGFAGATFEVEALYDPTLARPPRGTVIPFVITVGGGHTVSGSMMLKGAPVGLSELDQAVVVRYRGRITGPPTFT